MAVQSTKINEGRVKKRVNKKRVLKKLEKKRQDREANLQSAPAVQTKPSCQNVQDKDFILSTLV